jgi:thiosulfate/3-mercaptopyruvate sulfurtransferase
MKRVYGLGLLLLWAWLPVAMGEPLRVDAPWLHAQLGAPGLVILDVRPADDYQLDHVPGAISFPDALTYQQKSSGGRIVEPDVMQGLLRERGIDRNDLLVIYDDGRLVDASRVFWAMEVYGLQRVRVLDRGLAGWLARGYPTTADVPAVTPSAFVPSVDHRRIASKFSTRLATLNPHQVVIDARPETAYRGETSTAMRFGHIPTAINIPVHRNVQQEADGVSLRSPEQLQSLYATLPRDGKIILYCEVGKVSTTNYLVLRELGYDVANYDASWQEWGNDFALPIEK